MSTRKKGTIHYPVSAAEVVAQAWEDLGLEGDIFALNAIDECEEKKGLMAKLPLCYIKAEGGAYNVSEEETPNFQRFPEGASVTFRTPEKKRGKFQWAYDIELAE